ncbi:uncharacterized protein B0H64DRAFT_21599 [Chaetomium fimeti]|uniref:Uncharacterized protein n=1 Tax=Chaetomium fimeti TaxID=1854472 RepID=A0AAE0HQB4_9PEZI|nr:hypothetical protein B0H64DRAFT_21599 [Chaetomium fimeti]
MSNPTTRKVAERPKAAVANPRVSNPPTATTTSNVQANTNPPAENAVSRSKQAHARLFGQALRGTPYALIGVFALQLMGSKRLCSDYHVFVPTGHTARVIDQLAAASSGCFKKDKAMTRKVYLERDGVVSVVHICEPQAVHQAFPDSDDGVVTLFSARVLKPALLLNMAIYEWMDHHLRGIENWKKKGANADIIFLADYIARKEREDMKHATPAFLDAFFAANEKQEPVFFSIGLKRPAVKASGGATSNGNTSAGAGQGQAVQQKR